MKKYKYLTSLIEGKEGIEANKSVVRPDITYTDEALSFIELLSAGEPARVFGSYIYRNHNNNAADLDLFEEYSKPTLSQTVSSFYKDFVKVIKRISSRDLVYYSETKCGIDERYNLDIGKCELGVYTVNKDLRITIEMMRELFLVEDYKMLMKVLSMTKLGGDEYDIVAYILRKYYILRWSIEDILRGYIVKEGKKFMFIDGLTQNSLVKVDVWGYLNSKIVEITNAYFLSYGTGNKKIEIQSSNSVDTLRSEVEKLYYSNMWYSPFKMVKRSYALCRQLMDSGEYVVKKGDPLEYILSSLSERLAYGLSGLYQMKSELDTYLAMLDKYGKEVETKQAYEAVDNTKTRLSRNLWISEKLLIRWCKMLDIINASHGDKKIKELEDILEEMRDVIINETIHALNEINLNPPASVLLPSVLTYDPSIIRGYGYVRNPLDKYSALVGGYTSDDYYRSIL
jgi:hypothetical protein